MEAQFTISSIVFIVLLIVPGVFFKRFYFQGQFSKQFGVGLFADRLITSIFWGIIVQIITFNTFSEAFGFTYESIKKPITTAYTDLSKNNLPNFTSDNLWFFFKYLLTSILIAGILGTLFHQIIRLLKIDIKTNVFRFANQWNYYFRGDILYTQDFKGIKKGKWLSTQVDVVLESEGKTKMISGFLTQYTISSKTGELETIYLTNARRFSRTQKKYVDIPGDCLIIPYSKVCDMNITYNTVLSSYAKSQQILTRLIALLITLSLPVLLIYPWFLPVSILNTLLAVILSMLSWLLIMVVIINPFQRLKKLKLSLRALVVALLISVFSAIISLELLDLIQLDSLIGSLYRKLISTPWFVSPRTN